jgi:hypothetical protein
MGKLYGFVKATLLTHPSACAKPAQQQKGSIQPLPRIPLFLPGQRAAASLLGVQKRDFKDDAKD